MQIKRSRPPSRRAGADDTTSPTPRWPAPSPGRSVFCQSSPPRTINGHAGWISSGVILRLYNHLLYSFVFFFLVFSCIYKALYSHFCAVAMSRASKITLACTGLGTAGIIYFVHWSQVQEKAVRYFSFSYPSYTYLYFHFHFIQAIFQANNFHRPCTVASNATSKSSASASNDKPTSTCKRRSRRSIGKCKLCRLAGQGQGQGQQGGRIRDRRRDLVEAGRTVRPVVVWL